MTNDDRIAAYQKHMSVSLHENGRDEVKAGMRWTPLEAVAFIASGDEQLVAQVTEWCPRNNALPDARTAQVAAIRLSEKLVERQSDGTILSVASATKKLLHALFEGEVTAYVDAKPTLLTGLRFQQITYYGDQVGLGPDPKDGRYWAAVDVDAGDVRQLRTERTTAPPQPIAIERAGAKRGPKPKWDWLNLMGELVRIAHLDGLDEIGSQADVERWASQWLAEAAGTDAGPADSLVREHIAPIFAAIDRHNASLRP
jgi:hypothetical protein